MTEPDDVARVVNKKIESIKRMDISARNRKAILDFSDFCYSEGLGSRRVLKYLTTLPKLARMMKIDFEDAKRHDVEQLMIQVEKTNYTEWTKHDYRVTVKKFWKWLKKSEDEYPYEVKWIKTTTRKQRTKLPEELLTQEEVQRLIVAARCARDKAMISCLYESGCRVSELRCMKMKQMQE